MNENERLNMYDGIINEVLLGLFSKSRQGTIGLTDIDIGSKSHLAIINIAALASTVFQLRLEVKLGFFQRLKIKRLCGIKQKLYPLSEYTNAQTIHSIVNEVEKSYAYNILADIYDAYYNKELKENG